MSRAGHTSRMAATPFREKHFERSLLTCGSSGLSQRFDSEPQARVIDEEQRGHDFAHQQAHLRKGERPGAASAFKRDIAVDRPATARNAHQRVCDVAGSHNAEGVRSLSVDE